MVIHGATSQQERHVYRQRLQRQGIQVCNALQDHGNDCNIHYLFVLGQDNAPLENIYNMSTFVLNNRSALETDLLQLNVNSSLPEGFGLSTLFYIQEHFQSDSHPISFDMILFCKFSHMVDIQHWMSDVMSTAQYSLIPGQRQNMLIGDIRDKQRWPRELYEECPDPDNEFGYPMPQVQLYPAEECFAISANMIPTLLRTARDSTKNRCTEGHVGHDLTFLLYEAKAVLHWIRVPKFLQFWSQIE
jgi:hypothetical protein